MKRRNILTYLIILIIAFLNHFCEREAGDNTVQMEHLHGKWELYNQSYEVYVDGVKVDEGSDTFEPDEWIMELDSSGFCFIIFEGELESVSTFTVTENNLELSDPDDWETEIYKIKKLTSSKLQLVTEVEDEEEGIKFLFRETSVFRKISGISNFIIPRITTSSVTDINAFSAQSGGSASGGFPQEYCLAGVCWSTSPEPTVDPEAMYNPQDNCFTIDTTGIGDYSRIRYYPFRGPFMVVS